MIFRFSLDYLDRSIDPDGKFACGDDNYFVWKHADSDKTVLHKDQMRFLMHLLTILPHILTDGLS